MAEASSSSSLASTVDLKNYLECSICCGPFDDPRALPCLHPFCCGCLENWAKASSENKKIVSCPLCKKVYKIPEEEGIQGFPAHFLVADLQNTVHKAKQKHSTSDVCESHGEKKIYYCKNCECAACSDCGILDPTHLGHNFIRLKQAALQQSRSLGDLTRRVKDVKEKFESALQQAQQVKQDLDQAADTKIKAIKEARNDFMKQVDVLVKAYKQEVYHKREAKRRAVHQQIEKLQSDLAAITSSYEQATNVIESGSHSDIITHYPLLLSSLQQLIQSQLSTVDSTLGQIQLEPPPQQTILDLSSLEKLLCNKLHITESTQQVKVSDKTKHLSIKPAVTANLSAGTATNPSPRSSSANPFPTSTATAKSLPSSSVRGRFQSTRKTHPGTQSSHSSLSSSFQHTHDTQPRKTWEESGEIKIAPQARYLSIAIHPNGDFAVTSLFAPVTVFSKSGKFKHHIKGTPSCITDIAITPSNQYIIPGEDGSNEFYIYDNQGVLLRTIPTYNINNKPSTPNTVTIDSTGRIIVGLGHNDNKTSTVSIHQPDGTVISKFETKSSPRRLTCTPDDRLVISFADSTLQVMDQSGHNAHIIQHPPGFPPWTSFHMCCSKQGELFVISRTSGDKGVYIYVSIGGEYKYLDCISTRFNPYCIALSADQRLFVVDPYASVIQIFQ